jgi:hypothetical protein
MPNATVWANATALPKTTQHPDAELLTLAERAEVVLPSPSPATAGESQQFLDLVERIKNSSVELPIACKKEGAALQRFVASARSPPGNRSTARTRKSSFASKSFGRGYRSIRVTRQENRARPTAQYASPCRCVPLTTN